jgi:hypothetical protein
MQVNGTGITPQPTYPSVTPEVGSLALLDMYVFSLTDNDFDLILL